MNTKKILYSIYLALGLSVMSSCDNIDENDRYIPVDRPAIKRVTLIQEFTGVRCTNCPTAAETVHDIMSGFPGSVIAVCLHPENTAYTMPYRGTDLTCKEASVYYDFFKPDAFPAAMIDGAAPSNAIQQWSSIVSDQLKLEAPLDISLSCVYNSDDRRLKVDYSIMFNKLYQNECSVLVWIMENNIVGAQISGGKPVTDYVHNHVLRASLNGDWGTPLGYYFEPVNQSIDGSCEITLDEKWKAENCQVVAFVFRKLSGSAPVEQAAIIDVIQPDK